MGTVTVNGMGGSGTGGSNNGVYVLTGGAQITSSGGAVSVTGTGGTGGGANDGVLISPGGTVTTIGVGSVTVTGTGGTGGNLNYGVFVVNGGVVSATGSGGITISGMLADPTQPRAILGPSSTAPRSAPPAETSF